MREMVPKSARALPGQVRVNRRSSRRVPLVKLTIAALVAALAVAACSEDPAPPPAAVPSATPVILSPLTGEQVSSAVATRPVLVAKVDDTTEGRPQRGIGDADLIVQEPVESGETRLAAFFQSKSPDLVGPMRSVRTSDIGIVTPVLGTLVASGGSNIALNAMAKAKITVIDEVAPSMHRDNTLYMPFNLFVNLETIRKEGIGKKPPQPYLTFGDAELPAGRTISKVTMQYSEWESERFRFDPEERLWMRAEQGSSGYAAKSVLILGVKLIDAGYRDVVGAKVPEVVTTGTGKGFLVSGSQVRPIRWVKVSKSSPWLISTEAGMSIAIPRGNTWIGLVPNGKGHVKFTP